MNKGKLLFFILLFLSLLLATRNFAQYAQPRTKTRVAILCPLYLDSAFDEYSYKLGNNNMPQYVLTGLDFYNGVMMAVDSLNKENMDAEVWIYDTQKKGATLSGILQGMKALNFSLIIASFTSPAEQKTASEFSFGNNIPVISVTYPNDAGITANPYFIILNSTLKSHVDGIYQYVQQNFVATKPIFITKEGVMENRILSDFKGNDTSRHKLDYKVLHLNEDVYFTDIKPFLDSTKNNTIVCGSLDNSFASSLLKALGSNSAYNVTLIGMPNWDSFRKINNNTYDNVDVVYSTPFNYPSENFKVQALTADYKSKFYSRPSDLVFKGYEAMYHFTHLVTEYKNEFIGHLSDANFRWNNDFSIKPVRLTAGASLPDYLENKNLYFIKKNKGSLQNIVQLRKDS